MVFDKKGIVILNNDISFAGSYSLYGNYCFIKQSEKSNVVCFVPYKEIKDMFDIQGREVELVSDKKELEISITEKEKLVRIKRGISVSGYICNSKVLEGEFSKGLLLCINDERKIFYYIPSEEVDKIRKEVLSFE